MTPAAYEHSKLRAAAERKVRDAVSGWSWGRELSDAQLDALAALLTVEDYAPLMVRDRLPLYSTTDGQTSDGRWEVGTVTLNGCRVVNLEAHPQGLQLSPDDTLSLVVALLRAREQAGSVTLAQVVAAEFGSKATFEQAKVGDTVAWAKVPDGALVWTDGDFLAYRKSDRGAWIGEHAFEWRAWLRDSAIPSLRGWSWLGDGEPPTHAERVTIIALNVPADAAAEYLRELAARYAVLALGQTAKTIASAAT